MTWGSSLKDSAIDLGDAGITRYLSVGLPDLPIRWLETVREMA